jgi:hypothetical protein
MTLHLVTLYLSSEFVIKKGPKQWEAKIFSGKEEIAEIKKGEGLSFKLARPKDKMEWVLTNLVDGEHRPFSFSVRKAAKKTTSPYTDSNDLRDEIFVIHDQLFKHNGKFYMLASHPDDRSWNEYVNSSIRYICRLDDFPYSELSEVDFHHYTLRDKIKRLRGKAVGEASGLGIEERGHRVRLDSELENVGLFIAAISYLLYASS